MIEFNKTQVTPRRKKKMKIGLTNSNPDGDMLFTSQVADKNNSKDIADLIRRGNKARVAWGYLKALLNCGNDGADVAWGQRLLQSDQ